MVRLTSRSFLHLTPEVVDFEADYPFYAKVLQLGSEEVTFRSLEGCEGSVDRAVAEEHVVLASEVTRASQTSLLRRSVLVAEVHYGQVVAAANNRLTIRSGDHELVAAAAAVAVVPPIIALLLEDVEFNRDEWSPSDLQGLEQRILNRVLGTGGGAASNKISEILDGLMSEESHPVGDKMCQWIDPKTGEENRFPLQHAIDFAYYADGGVVPVPRSVGDSFCRLATPQHPSSTSDRSRSSVRDVQALFDPFADDDDSPQDEVDRGVEDGRIASTSTAAAKRQQSPRTAEVDEGLPPTKRQCVQAALDQDTLIIARISDDPDLLERFLAIRKEAKAKEQPDSHHEGDGGKIATVQKPSQATKDKKSSKYAFAPSEDQVLVHERVTSEKHKGKSANVFCRNLVRSEHVDFKAVPGICTRVYDVRFGSGGLSIRHFARLSRDERVAWLESGGSNFDNLSATAEFSAASPASRIEDIVDSARIFLTYAREFCCAELIELVERIVKFVDHTLSQVSWAPKELSSLVFWVNDVLEDFRTAAEEGSELRAVLQRCTTDDRLLKDVMFVKVHRQVESVRQELLPAPSRTERHAESGAQSHNSRNHDGKKRFGRIPKEVLRKIPVLVDPASGKSRRLCMRFLSQAGCAVDGDGSCPSEHAHFLPKQLPPIVRTEIGRRFGGLKDEHKQL